MQKPNQPSLLLLALIFLGACSSEPIRKKHFSNDLDRSESTKPSLVSNAQKLFQKNDIHGATAIMESIHPSEISNQERSEYWNLKGLLALNGKRYDLASQNFKRAVEENQIPDFRGYYQFNLATALNGSENFNESFDILNAIDLSSIDQSQQKKVLTLKEKVAKAITKQKNKQKAPISEIANQDGPPSTDASGVLNPNENSYTGGVSRKKIGLLIPMTGKYENFGKKVQKAVELAFQHSKDSSARDYELVIGDSGENAESQLKALQKLVEEDQVIGIIGPVISKGIELLAKKAVYYQVPMITLAQIQSPVASHLFFCSVSNKDQASQVVQYAVHSLGYNKFAIIAPSNKPGEEMANTFKEEVLTQNGEVSHLEFYEPNLTDFRKPVDRILGLANPEKRKDELKMLEEKRKELNITHKTSRTSQYYTLPPIIDFDAVFIADEAKIAGQIIPTFTYRDAKNLKFIGISSWNSSQLIQRAQDQVEDAIFPVAFNTLNANENTKAFFDLYNNSYNSAPNELDAISFDAAALMINAMGSSPSTRDQLRVNIEGSKGVQGATGEFSVEDHRCARTLSLIQVEKGKFEIISNENRQ
jgi:ABC-type branched-subunit amino acid transport system substrate-binding protein